jgi:voltage-gated potassium channel
MDIKSIVEQSDTTAGKVFDLTIQALIVVSLVSFSIETLPDLSEGTRRLLRLIEVGTVALFTAEYLVRLVVSDRPLLFVFSWLGAIDLLAIVPFYLSTGIDLRAIRAARLLRLVRAIKLLRYSQAIRRFHRALVIAKEEMVLFFGLTLFVLYFAAVGIYFFEHDAQPEAFSSVFNSLWWAVTTLTTVGYGDSYPVTVGGRIFTFCILMVGLGVVAVPTGLLSSALSKARDEESETEGDR